MDAGLFLPENTGNEFKGMLRHLTQKSALNSIYLSSCGSFNRI
jgi:hypothetical protein